MKILDLGLKFAPEKSLDKFETYIYLKKFMRKLNLKKHFFTNKDTRIRKEPLYVHTGLKNNSIFNPTTSGNQCMGAFQKMVEDDLRKLDKRSNHKTKHVWKTIKALGERKEVVIRPADKGGGLVILNKSDYEEEIENLLWVENTYKKRNKNPKRTYEKKLKA